MSTRIRKAVLPAAGLGTRLLPATKALPKELLPLVTKPVLQMVVEEAATAGVEEIIFVINVGKEAIWNHFSPDRALIDTLQRAGKDTEAEVIRTIGKDLHFTYVLQSEQRGDGHALYQARHAVGDEPFLVLFGDDVVLTDSTPSVAEQLIAVHAERGGCVIAVQDIPRADTSTYGIVTPGDRGNGWVDITALTEKPDPKDAPSTLGITGKYLCTPDIFPILAQNPQGSGEIRLIDALSALIGTLPMTGCLFTGTRLDTGNPYGYTTAFIECALRDPAIGARLTAYLKERISC